MKFFNYYNQNSIRLGAACGEQFLDVAASSKRQNSPAPTSMADLMAAGENGIVQIAALYSSGAVELDCAQIEYAPAVTNPEKILCVGLNYLEHSKETGITVPDYPALFSKFSNALAAHQEIIHLPTSSAQCDYEAELVIVIGRKCRQVTKETALDYVFGYTVGNDLSARDLQMRTSQWLLGKTPDQFAPIGPCIVPATEIDPQQLKIQSYVNGSLRQNSTTSAMIFDCATIVSYISEHMTLKPGDIIFTGTPSGVILGLPEKDQVWLKSGDKVSIKIEKIGTLTNTIA